MQMRSVHSAEKFIIYVVLPSLVSEFEKKKAVQEVCFLHSLFETYVWLVCFFLKTQSVIFFQVDRTDCWMSIFIFLLMHWWQEFFANVPQLEIIYTNVLCIYLYGWVDLDKALPLHDEAFHCLSTLGNIYVFKISFFFPLGKSTLVF